MHFLWISRLHSDPLQAVSFALEGNLGRFFLLALFWSTSTFMKMRLPAGIWKGVALKQLEKWTRKWCASLPGMPSPVAAPFVCSCLPVSLFSSAVCRQTMKIFSFFSQSWTTAFWEDGHNIHLIAGENPMAFFLLPVAQSHAEHVHSFCRIATFKMLLQHLTCFLLTFV